MAGEIDRDALCQSKGLGGVARVYELVARSANKPASVLLAKGLNARLLEDLGYDRKGMLRLGYPEEALAKLGFRGAPHSAGPGSAGSTESGGAEGRVSTGPSAEDANAGSEPHSGNSPGPAGSFGKEHMPTNEEIRALIAAGSSAGELRALGVLVSHCKAAGLGARELLRVGYDLNDLADEFKGSELRTIGFRPQELRRRFGGAELRRFGFSASEMRAAGFGARELLNFGFNENQVISCGYSINELVREGLSRHTVDRKKFHNA